MSTRTEYPADFRRPGAELCWDIGLAGDRIDSRGTARGRGLALSPGMASANASLGPGAPVSRIVLPPGGACGAERCAIPVTPSGQTGEDGPRCLYTSAVKEAGARAVPAGELVSYRITFTNHGSLPLDGVWICDGIREGLIPESIRPAPGPGETLGTGVSLGPLGPGQSAALAYDAIAVFTGNRPLSSRARVRYHFTDPWGCGHWGTGVCRGRPVLRLPSRRPVCRWVERRFSLCDAGRLRRAYVYHRGADCFSTPEGAALAVKFGVAVRYLDRRGESRTRLFEDSVGISGLGREFVLSEARIRLTDLLCRADGRGGIAAGFLVSVT